MFEDVFVGPTTIVRSRSTLLVVAHAAAEISDREWDECLQAEAGYQGRAKRAVKILVAAADGGTMLTAKQRRLLRDRLPDVSTAVLTSSAATRAVLTAISWFSSGTKGFAPEQVAEALAHLGEKISAGDVSVEIAAMRKRLRAG